MRINARLDNPHASKLAYIRQQTHQGVTEVIKIAIDIYYEQLRQECQNPLALFTQTGFIGCGESDADLSANYKSILQSELQAKYDHC
jgi:hypothetical protein